MARVKLSDLPQHVQDKIMSQPQFNAAARPRPIVETPAKTSPLERTEQRIFANWTKSNGYPRVWHSMNARSKATPGTPDFVVGVNGYTLWIEFKLPGGKLSKDQEDFKRQLEQQKIQHHVCFNADDAIKLVNAHADIQRSL